MTDLPDSLTAAARSVLTTAAPAEKARKTAAFAAARRHGGLAAVGQAAAPERPARPERPLLQPPRQLPRRKIGPAPEGRIALLHAIAHIELNAIDLAWDLLARFAVELPPRARDDWLRVAEEEAKHFSLLNGRLADLGAAYGDLPAHDGLWQAALATRHDLLARLAVVPLVLEARGLDVTPAMIEKLEAVGDGESAAVLKVIYAEEIGHVAIGMRSFEAVCRARGLEPKTAWREQVRQHFKGALKPPFNDAARREAGFPVEDFAGRVAP